MNARDKSLYFHRARKDVESEAKERIAGSITQKEINSAREQVEITEDMDFDVYQLVGYSFKDINAMILDLMVRFGPESVLSDDSEVTYMGPENDDQVKERLIQSKLRSFMSSREADKEVEKRAMTAYNADEERRKASKEYEKEYNIKRAWEIVSKHKRQLKKLGINLDDLKTRRKK